MSDELDLAAIGLSFARAVSEDLRALVGVEIAIKGPTVEWLDRRAALIDDDAVGYTRCRAKDESGHGFFLVMPRAEAVTLACLLMGQGEERIKELRTEPMDEDNLDAYGEVISLANAVLSRILSEENHLPAVAIEQTAEMDSPIIDQSWMPGDEFYVARYRVLIPGFEDGRLDLIFPPEVATSWFGIGKGGVRRGADGTYDDEDGEEVDGDISIVVIDSSMDDRNEAEDLEDDLGWSVWALDPVEFDPDDLEEMVEVSGFFIEWDLNVRSGIDLMETLRSDDRTRGIPIIIVSREPTERMVKVSVKAGADSFAKKPYNGEEMTARLLPLLARARARARQEA